MVSAALPARSLHELIALARERPGALNYSSAGAGASQHLAGELFKLRTGTNIVHVPYKGSAPALTALIAGEVQLSFSNTVAILQHVRAGRHGVRHDRLRHALGLRKGHLVRVRIDDLDAVAHRMADSRQHPHRGRASEKQQPRNRQHRLDVDFHGTSAFTSHGKGNHPGTLHPVRLGRETEQPRLAVGDRAPRFAQHRRARATAAHPAVVVAGLRHHGDIADASRARRLAPHDRDQCEALFVRRQVRGECQQIGTHDFLVGMQRPL